MTPNVFERCVNILTIDSSVFTVEVEAQILKNASEKQTSESNNIMACRKKRFTIELDERADGFFNITERERYPVR